MKKLFLVLIPVLILFFIGLAFIINSKKKSSTDKIIDIPNSQLSPTIPITSTPLTLDSIFDGNLKRNKDTITLIATGDVIPARVVNINAIAKNNFLWPWEETAPFLKQADITLINLETPIFDGCPQINTGFTFCGEDEHVEGMLAAGVDVANIANNHSGNYGEDGLNETIAILEKNSIVASGYSKVGYKIVKGIKFAFLGYNDIGAPYVDEQQMVEAVKEARKNADVVVVSFHWGTEYKTQPDQRQIDLAHLAIDNGADLVIGNHPHWVQPIELYKDKYIMYAHGNFIFDQMWSEETKKGVVGKYVFNASELIDVEYYPIYIEDYGQPNFMEGQKKMETLQNLKQASLELGNRK